MTAAIAIIIVGFTMVYTALTGQSFAEALSGKGRKLDPKGGTGGSDSGGPVPGPDVTGGTDPKGQFKGPNAHLLRALADSAVKDYHLSISQICRPADATYGAPHSLHKECRAFDATGSVPDRVAFARYAKGVAGVAEVFCDQAGMSAPGYEHTTHVHVGA